MLLRWFGVWCCLCWQSSLAKPAVYNDNSSIRIENRQTKDDGSKRQGLALPFPLTADTTGHTTTGDSTTITSSLPFLPSTTTVEQAPAAPIPVLLPNTVPTGLANVASGILNQLAPNLLQNTASNNILSTAATANLQQPQIAQTNPLVVQLPAQQSSPNIVLQNQAATLGNPLINPFTINQPTPQPNIVLNPPQITLPCTGQVAEPYATPAPCNIVCNLPAPPAPCPCTEHHEHHHDCGDDDVHHHHEYECLHKHHHYYHHHHVDDDDEQDGRYHGNGEREHSRYTEEHKEEYPTVHHYDDHYDHNRHYHGNGGGGGYQSSCDDCQCNCGGEHHNHDSFHDTFNENIHSCSDDCQRKSSLGRKHRFHRHH